MTSDHEFCERLARRAGELLCEIRARMGCDDPRALGKAGDQQSSDFLMAELRRERPRDAVLCEETTDSPERLERSRVWIVDPLDGTREFGEGRHDWAVHVALWEEGRLTAGAVALPGRDTVLSTSNPPARRPRSGRLRIAASRTRAPALLEGVAADLAAEIVPLGSAGYKVSAVLLGEVDAYVHAGGQYEWDSAAPVAVARASGAHASRLDGSPLEYNRPDPWCPDLVVCRCEVASSLLAAVASHARDGA